MKWRSSLLTELTDGEYRDWYLLMSESRRARVDRLIREEDRKRSILGEVLARKAASEETGIPPEEIDVQSAPDGRPYVKDQPVFLSITHSGGLAAAAADILPVGIDAERIRPMKLLPAKRVFSDEEKRYLFGTDPDEGEYRKKPDEDTLQRFFFLWTRYEARIKRSGVPLGALPEKGEAVLLETFRQGEYVISLARTPVEG